LPSPSTRRTSAATRPPRAEILGTSWGVAAACAAIGTFASFVTFADGLGFSAIVMADVVAGKARKVLQRH
jgi:hypothetical protein